MPNLHSHLGLDSLYLKGGVEMAWATTADVLNITTKAVGQDNIEAAQIMIEIFSDVTEESSDNGLISGKNLRLLKCAVAYQAAWMTAHPDQFTSTDFETFQMDGLSVTNANENSLILAPMARRCIKRLSWKRNRSIHINPAFGRRSYVPPTTADQNNSVLDDYRSDWRPLDL